MTPERNEGGEFVESVTLDAVLGVFADVEGSSYERRRRRCVRLLA